MSPAAPWLALLAATLCHHWLAPAEPRLPPGVADAARVGVLLVAAVAALLLLAMSRGRRAPEVGGAGRPGAFAVVGLVTLVTLLAVDAQLATRLPAAQHGTSVRATGRIEGVPSAAHDVCRFAFRTQTLNGREQALRLRVRWYLADAGGGGPASVAAARSERAAAASAGAAGAPAPCAHLVPGARWELVLRLYQPRGLANPGTFDLDGWLFRHHFDGRATVRDAARARRLAAPTRQALLARLRLTAAGRLAARMPASAAGALPLLKALTLGLREPLPERWREALTRTGTGHLLAISGLHVGLVAGLCWGLARWVGSRHPGAARSPRPARLPPLAALAGATLFALLAGFTVPTQRALASLLVALGAPLLLGRGVGAARGLASALLAVLLVDPLAPLDPGFWLSFGAVACLLLVHRPGRGRIAGALVAQGAVWVGLLAPGIAFFGQVSWLAPWVNLLAVPVFGLVLVPLSLLSLSAAVVGLPGASALLGFTGDLLLLAMRALVWLAETAPGVLAVQRPAWVLLCLQVAGLLLLIGPLPGARLAAMALSAPLLLWAPPAVPAGTVELTVLDVGQGLAAVVRTRRHVLVYDTGPRWFRGGDAGSSVLLPFLRQRGIDRVDMVVVSHGDIDHRGGLASLRQAFPAAPLRMGGGGAPSGVTACRAGAGWRWEGVRFRFLHPPAGRWQGNDGSCVLRVSVGSGAGSRVLLLTGDIQAPAERHLVRRDGALLAAHVVVAPHHGSATSSTLPLVRAVAAQHVIFATGYGNRWGFPAPSVVARWRAGGARVYDTGVRGAVTVRLRHGRVSRPRGERERRGYWARPAPAQAPQQ